MTTTEAKAVEAARREARTILESNNCYPVVEGTHHASRVRLAEAVDFLSARVERLEKALRYLLVEIQEDDEAWSAMQEHPALTRAWEALSVPRGTGEQP